MNVEQSFIAAGCSRLPQAVDWDKCSGEIAFASGHNIVIANVWVVSSFYYYYYYYYFFFF